MRWAFNLLAEHERLSFPWKLKSVSSNGAFTPEQDNDKTNVDAQVQLLSCRCLVVVLLWCESTIRYHTWDKNKSLLMLDGLACVNLFIQQIVHIQGV